MIAKVLGTGRRLGRDTSGLALLEFAFTLPILLVLSLTGAELTNYITTRMRVAQIALHLADNAARMGAGGQLTAKTISETDINDLLTGAALQSGELNLRTQGRVILTQLEPMASPSTKYKIGWRRCYGLKTSYTPLYPPKPSPSTAAPTTNLDGIGPVGRQATAPANGATMFVEVHYEYQPLVKASLAPTAKITETASMMVRDARDLTRVYNTEGATPTPSC